MGSKFLQRHIVKIIVLILLVALIGARAWVDVMANQNYETQVVQINPFVEVKVSYPPVLFVTEKTYPIIVQFIDRQDGIFQTFHEYEVEFKSEGLIFTQSGGGEIVPSRFEFTVGVDDSHSSGLVHVIPIPLHDLPERFFVEWVVYKDNTALLHETLVIEKLDLWLSILFSYFLELSVFTIFAGWVISAIQDQNEYIKEKKQELAKEISEVRRLLTEKKIIEAINTFCEIKPRVDDYGAQNSDFAKEKINGILKTFYSEDFVRQILDRWEKDFSKQKPMWLQNYFDLEKECNVDDNKHNSRNVINDLRSLYEIIYPTNSLKEIEVMKNLLEVWDRRDISWRGMIVLGIIHLAQQRFSRLSKMTHKELEEENLFITPNQRRLARIPALQAVLPALGGLPPYEYKLPVSPDQDHLTQDNPLIVEWLNNQHGLSANPFGDLTQEQGLLLETSWEKPQHWDNLDDEQVIHAHCLDEHDCRLLLDKYQREVLAGKRVFPIRVDLSRLRHTSLVAEIAHSAAKRWLQILSKYPEALLDLPIRERKQVADMLCWHFGSLQELILFLKVKNSDAGGEEKADEKAKAKEELLYFLSERDCSQPSGTMVDNLLLDWLSVRPPGLDATTLILLDNHQVNNQAGRKARLSQLAELLPALVSQQFAVKIFSVFDDVIVPVEFKYPLRWADKELGEMLQKRFQTVGQCDFSILFHSRDAENVEQYKAALIRQSQGLLDRLLRLGNKLLHKHVSLKDSERYITEEEFYAVIKNA